MKTIQGRAREAAEQKMKDFRRRHPEREYEITERDERAGRVEGSRLRPQA